jgi:hypothetical protein
MTPVPGLGAGIASQGFPDGINTRRCQLAFRVVFERRSLLEREVSELPVD